MHRNIHLYMPDIKAPYVPAFNDIKQATSNAVHVNNYLLHVTACDKIRTIKMKSSNV